MNAFVNRSLLHVQLGTPLYASIMGLLENHLEQISLSAAAIAELP